MPGLPKPAGDVDEVLAGHRRRLDDLVRRLQPVEIDATMRPATIVSRLSHTSPVSNNVTTLITWELADDPFGAWSEATPGEVVARRPGLYVVHLLLAFPANTAGSRWGFVVLNSTDLSAVPNPTLVFAPGTGLAQGAQGGGTFRLAEGDVLRAYVYQNSGTSLVVQGDTGGSVGSYMSLAWIGR